MAHTLRLAISLLVCFTLKSFVQAEAAKPLAEPEFEFNICVEETQANPTKIAMWSIQTVTTEGVLSSCFIGKKIPLVVSGGKVEFGDQGIALQIQAMLTEKNKIHVGGICELREPLLDKRKQLKMEALGSQSFSEVVNPEQTIKVKLDLREKNGKQYTVVLKVKGTK
jgi:hypothetical protein